MITHYNGICVFEHGFPRFTSYQDTNLERLKDSRCARDFLVFQHEGPLSASSVISTLYVLEFLTANIHDTLMRSKGTT